MASMNRRWLCLWAAVILTVVGGVLFSWTGDVARAADLESRYADFDGVRVHYLNGGEGEEALVFIHGWSCDHTFWRLQAPEIAEKYRVIVLDLPGHGKSDKPRVAYTQAYFVNGLETVVRDAGLRRVVLAGHSMGFSVARQYALKHPDLIKGMINVDGAIFRPPKEKEALEKWRKEVKAWADSFKGPDARASTISFIESMFVPATPADVRHEIVAVMLACPRHVATSAMDNMGDLSLWKETPVKAPTLAIYSRLAYLEPDNEAFMKKLSPNLEYHEWEDVGHFYMFERPKELTKAILSFLDRLAAE